MAITEALSHPFISRKIRLGSQPSGEDIQVDQPARLNTPNQSRALADESKEKDAESTAIPSSKATAKQAVKTRKLIDLFRDKLKEDRTEPGDYMIEPNSGLRLLLKQLMYLSNYKNDRRGPKSECPTLHCACEVEKEAGNIPRWRRLLFAFKRLA